MFLILALGSLSVITYQNASATGDEIISRVIKIDNNTVNGPVLANNVAFGSSIANIGNLNNVGVYDIAVGAPFNGTGAVYMLLMNSGGLLSDTIKIDNNTVNGPVLLDDDQFGSSIANIGDLNGDGISDIAVGASGDGTGGSSRGAIHLMFMSNDSVGAISHTIEISSATVNGPVLLDDDQFGSSIANIGDLNGDGISDIAVGAIGDDTGGSLRGAIHVMLMNRNGTVSSTMTINGATPNGPTIGDYYGFGGSIAGVDDLNGDNIKDILVSSSVVSTIHLLHMNRNGTVSSTIVASSDATLGNPDLDGSDRLGSSLVDIGDLNGDGISDIIAGASFDEIMGSDDGLDTGAIYVLYMNNSGIAFNYTQIGNNTVNGLVLDRNDAFGYSIADIGDLNGDGISDIVVGAPGDGIEPYTVNDYYDLGAIYVMFSSNTTLIPIITSITSNATSLGTLVVGDTILFTLTPDSTKDGATINGAFNSVALSWSSIDNGTTYTATYTISEGESDQITPLQITNVTITDKLGNTSLPFDGTDILHTIDANSPQFASAKTLSDSQIAITLDQSVVDSSAVPTDFTLGGVTGGSINSITSVSNNTITLGINNTTISDSDNVTISYARTSGSFDDVSGNSLLDFAGNVTNNLGTSPIITLNGANPQIIMLGTSYTELGATTSDGSLVTINATEFTNVIGTYSIYYDSVDASGNSAIQVIRTVNVIEATVPTFCAPPNSGDWIITTSCTVNTSATAQENVIVQNDSILSISSGITLNIDFAAFSLTVQSGSGVLIKSGGTVT